jgi:hypothetical protein
VAAVAAAIPTGDDPRPSSGSAAFLRWNAGQKPPADAELPPFLGFPVLASVGTDFAARAVRVEAPAGSDMLRILFKGKRGAHWTIYGAAPGSTVVVPSPTDFGVETDRFVEGDLESVLVNGIDFVEGVDLGAVAAPGGLALDLLLGFVERASFIDIKKTPIAP